MRALSFPEISVRQRERLRPWLSSALLLPLAVAFAFEGGAGIGVVLYELVRAFNLIVHEAGHFFFRFFGTFLMFAGGTILQLALPALFVFQGVYHDSRWGTQLALLWLGHSFVDVSVYAADAQARALPLIGNLGPESHDWWNMLRMLGWLDHTPLVAAAFTLGALVSWAAMLVVPRWIGH